MSTVAVRALPRGAGRRTGRSALRAVIGAATLRAMIVVAATLAAAACGRSTDTPATAAPVVVIDDAGRMVQLPRPATRVISLIPAQTEVIALLAGADVLLARTTWDVLPELQHLPSIGNALTPSVEWLAAQRPELVVAWPDARSRDVVRRLEEVGIPVYASRVESVAEIRSMVARLGVLLGTPAAADSLVAAIDAGLDSVRALVAGRPRPTVLYLLNADPPMVAGPGTFVDELITVAGGTNVFADLRQPWPQVSLEEIVRRQPDVIIRPTERAAPDPLAGLAGRPGWRDVQAVRDGRVHGVDPFFYNRPGAGVAAAAGGLAGRIHGSAAPAPAESAGTVMRPGAPQGRRP